MKFNTMQVHKTRIQIQYSSHNYTSSNQSRTRRQQPQFTKRMRLWDVALEPKSSTLLRFCIKFQNSIHITRLRRLHFKSDTEKSEERDKRSNLFEGKSESFVISLPRRSIQNLTRQTKGPVLLSQRHIWSPNSNIKLIFLILLFFCLLLLYQAVQELASSL